MLRTLSTYLHKYIKYNPKSKDFVEKYYAKKFKDSGKEEAEVFYAGMLEWIGGLNMTNFQEYQRIWQE